MVFNPRLICFFKDLFATLVPISVHTGLQTFKAKKMEALNLEIGKLRQATELLNTYIYILFFFF